MQAEHLCQWLIFATRDDSPDATNWKKIVSNVQAEFLEGGLAEDCTWQKVVLFPNGKRDFRGIGIVEVLWKAVASLLNRHLTEDYIPQCAPRFSGRPGDGDCCPQGQTAPTAYGHDGGGPLQGIS